MSITKNYKGCEKDLQNALKLIFCTGFKLYEPEAELILAKAYLGKDKDKAKTYANSAYEKAKEMGYHSPQLEAFHLLTEIE
ncbi:MAG: hypothetical protein AB1630_05430 [bacterium]